MTKTALLLGSSIVLTATQIAAAQLVKFTILDGAASADDMTPDGRYVVGSRLGGGTYRLDTVTGVTTILPPEAFDAVGVSDDGSVIVGDVPDPEGIGSETAGRWTEATGWVSLGALPNALGCPSRSNSYEVSADGSVVVGLSWDGCNGRGFRWTQATDMIELGVLANGGNRASVVSGDGSLIGGFAQGSFSRTPAIWTGGGAGQLLDPPNGDVQGEVLGISDDGTILLGVWDSKPFKWVEGSEIEVFNPVLTGWSGNAMDIADDGTIVGFDFLVGNRRAWIRPNGGPIVDLSAYLTSLGVTGLPSTLEVCQAISTNGNIIIGHGFLTGAWMINLCTADLDGTGDVGFSDLLVLLAAWGPCDEGPCAADLDGSGDVGFSDLLVLLSGWGECP